MGDVAEGVVEVGVGGFPRGIQEGDHVSVGVGNIESISVEEGGVLSSPGCQRKVWRRA